MSYEIGRRYRIVSLSPDDAYINCNLEGRIAIPQDELGEYIILEDVDGLTGAAELTTRGQWLGTDNGYEDGVCMASGIVLAPVEESEARPAEPASVFFQALATVPGSRVAPIPRERFDSYGKLAEYLIDNNYQHCTGAELDALKRAIEGIFNRLDKERNERLNIFTQLRKAR